MNSLSEPTHEGDSSRGSRTGILTCPACGAAARRAGAHFCSTCGRGLREHAYAPADSLFASYHQQHTRPAMLFEGVMANSSISSSGGGCAPQPTLKARSARLFASEGNTAAAIALVLVFSSLVPVVGILFCPFAVLIGGFGLVEARFAPSKGGARLAVVCIVSGILIAGAQFLLLQLF